MPEKVIIAAGGSGLSVANAIVELLATGFNPLTDADEITIIPFDIDKSSAEYIRLETIVGEYETLRQITNCTPDELSSVMHHARNVTPQKLIKINLKALVKVAIESLNDAVKYATLLDDSPEKLLYECLFSDGQGNMALGIGAQGDMQLGSFIVAKELATLPLDTMFPHVADYNVIVVGGLYGGTGPSALPTFYNVIRKYLSDNYRHNHHTIGFVMMMPHFLHDTHANVDGINEDMPVDPMDQTVRTKNALAQYINSDADFIACVGGEQRYMTTRKDENGQARHAETIAGGNTQLNPAMPEHLMAALCCIEAFTGEYRTPANDKAATNTTKCKQANPGVAVHPAALLKPYVYIDAADYGMSNAPFGNELALCIKRFNAFLHMFWYYFKDAPNCAFRNFRPNGNETVEEYKIFHTNNATATPDDADYRNTLMNILHEIGLNIPNVNSDIFVSETPTAHVNELHFPDEKTRANIVKSINANVAFATTVTSSEKVQVFLRALWYSCAYNIV